MGTQKALWLAIDTGGVLACGSSKAKAQANIAAAQQRLEDAQFSNPGQILRRG